MSFPQFFRNHPNMMSDEELGHDIKNAIIHQIPESHYLDYKKEIHIKNKNDKKELAKDISSFANTHGGVLIYGVPEEKDDSIPIPSVWDKCGLQETIDVTAVEQILKTSISPQLSETFIKLITIENKNFLIIYHPESYLKPHMVEGYKDARYYKRGNFESTRMSEKDVEAAYAFRRVTVAKAEEFFLNGNFFNDHQKRIAFRITTCPIIDINLKNQMFSLEFYEWLKSKLSFHAIHQFVDGWELRHTSKGITIDDVRIFHNGGVSCWCDSTRWTDFWETEDRIYIEVDPCLRQIQHLMNFLKEYYNFIFVSHNCAAACFFKIEFSNLTNSYGISTSEKERISNCTFWEIFTKEKLPLQSDNVFFIEETSISQIQNDPDAVFNLLKQRIYATFGVWVDLS